MKSNLLGSRIKQLREENKLNQINFAKHLNIANTTLSQYESGHRIPSDEIKIKIADYFGVSLDWLMGQTEKRTPGNMISNENHLTGKRFICIKEQQEKQVDGVLYHLPDDIKSFIAEKENAKYLEFAKRLKDKGINPEDVISYTLKP